MPQEQPAGFELLTRPSPLIDPWRPLYARTEAHRMILGLYVRKPHLNSRDTVHGGLFAALADQAMGMSCSVKLRAEGIDVANLWTTSLTVDFIANARPGQWLAFETVYAHVGKTLCQAEINITADGETVARGRATFRVALARGPGHASSSS